MSRKIIGVTVGTPTPRANLKQTDPRKADYVKGKDIIPEKLSQLENDAGYLSEDDVSGITPHIGVNGNWFIGETDTGVKAEVPEFKLKHYTATNAAGVRREGIEIRIVTRDENGEEITQSTGVVWGTDFEATGGLDSPGGSSGGAAGSGTAVVTAPHIGENGNWFIGETDTGVKAQGEDGVGIADIQKRTVAGREVLYIILSDGTEKGYTLPVPENGDDYVLTDADKQEIAELAADLVDVPEVSGGGYVAQDTAPEDTTLLWVDTSDDSDDDYQEAVNAALAQAKASGEFDGADGHPGKDGTNGKDGTSVTVKSASESTADGGSNVVTFSDGKTLTVKNGSKGSAGTNGKDGVSATHSWNGTTLTVTSASGTSSANLKGDKGDKGDSIKGDKGDDGVGVSSVKQTTTSSADGGSNVVTVTLSNGTTSTFTVKNGSKGSAGTNGKDGTTPVKGTDYFTAADKAEMVSQVKASLTKENWTFTLDDGSTVTKAVYIG